VEEKFALDNVNDTRNRLADMGFLPAQEPVEFVDWYYDVLGMFPCIRNDKWLRCRIYGEQSVWHLKSGILEF